jgi:cysteinyl-tRNA synthetase
MPPASHIRIYSTLTRTKEPFEPVQAGKVGMYLCGPTVYKPSHIGHMVGPVIFDAIKRYLVYSGYQVTWVVNITDVDDKLIAESSARGISMSELAEEMTADYVRNLAALGVDTIDHFPKATEHIDEIIRLTGKLIDRGFAYASDGDVYFEVGKDAQYGKLSRRSLESMQGEGGEMAVRKRSPADFALWKSAKPGEPSWDSPWGKGRPGWHIECSAMSGRLLGETFDIHGGGLDLIFPHHENEIAQSESAHGKPQAKYWLHNGLMQAAHEAGKVGGRATRTAAGGAESSAVAKISKSTGASPFSELLERHSPEAIRFFLLSTHYRSPIQYSEELLEETARSMEAFYRFFKRYERIAGESFFALSASRNRAEGEFDAGTDSMLREAGAIRQRFLEAMDDDFNTGVGVAALFDLVRALNKFVDTEKLEQGQPDAAKVQALKQATRTFRELAGTLGLFIKPVEAKAPGGDDGLIGQLMQLLIDVRAGARKNKDFATADTIRKRLGEIGIALEDRPDGPDWARSG